MEPTSTPTQQSQPQPESQIAHDFSPFAVVYTDGRVHRFLGTATVPPSSDSDSDAAVRSKDVHIPTTGFSARLYLPNHQIHKIKLPLLIYFHGGGFVIESSQSPTYHHYLNHVAAEVPAVIVSVDYRRAPEHPLPAAYDDSWAAVLWAASLSDPWLKDHADLSRMFFAGDSAGANIAHHMAIRFGTAGPDRPVGTDLAGLILVHPFFTGKDPIGSEKTQHALMLDRGERFWRWVCPTTSGLDDPWVNPASDGKLGAMGTRRVVVLVAELDHLRDRGVWYVEVLRKSGWPGAVELVEAKGEGHVFHLLNPANDNSDEMMKKLVEFINS